MRTYTFLAAILPFGCPEWEKLCLFLNLLVKKLPSPISEDLTKGILEDVDFDSYRNTILKEQAIILENKDAEIEPVPVSGGGGVSDPAMDYLSQIVSAFNTRFGAVPWTDVDKVKKQIMELPAEVAKNEACQNAVKNSNTDTARIESDAALRKVILASMNSGLELFKQYQDNKSFQTWLQDYVFDATYNQVGVKFAP